METLDLFPLDVECSIYGMTTFDGNILVSTSNCKVYCITFNKFKPHIREIEFAYIPNGAKIMLISALQRDKDDYVIAITHSKSTIYYLNLYVSGSSHPKLDLDQLAQGCQTIRLKYVPYHLYPTTASTGPGKRSPCWLLSGGDNRIHIFIEDEKSFEEKPIEDYYPELEVTFDCPALWIDVLNFNDNKERAVALSFENGSVRLFYSSWNATEGNYNLVENWRFEEYTTIVPCVRLFRIKNSNSSSDTRTKLGRLNVINSDTSTAQSINLLLVSSTNSCLVFEDIIKNGLAAKRELPDSQRLDCNTTAAIGDTNFDGRNELVIGNHGRELLFYRYDVSSCAYELDRVQDFNNPIYSIAMLDITKDGLNDICILLSNGVMILQSSVQDAIDICRKRVGAILSKMM